MYFPLTARLKGTASGRVHRPSCIFVIQMTLSVEDCQYISLLFGAMVMEE